MAYELNFQAEGSILRVDISGDRTKGDLTSSAKEAWREVARVARDKNLRRILVISRATGNYPTLSAFQINSTLEDCGVQRGWVIAFVNIDPDSYQDIKFAETVAVNRGFTVKVFNNTDKARMWLS